MRINIQINKPHLSNGGYMHWPLLLLSWGADAFLLYFLFIYITVSWGECARNQKEAGKAYRELKNRIKNEKNVG